MENLKAMLLRHEGFRRIPYRDTKGKLTIGIGRNLQDVGISQDEAFTLLSNDIMRAAQAARQAFHWFGNLDPVRQDVVVSMIFNMGLSKFREFENTIAAIEKGDYSLASVEMLDSEWHIEVKNRAKELSEMMKTGHYMYSSP